MNKKHKFNYTLVNKLIEDRKLDPRDIAKNCEISTETLRRALVGKLNLSKPVIALMALDLSVDKLDLVAESENHAA